MVVAFAFSVVRPELCRSSEIGKLSREYFWE